MPAKNLLYLHSNAAEKHIVCHGVDFKGFIASLEKPLGNLLLIKHDYAGGTYHGKTGFKYVGGGEIEKLAAENICKYGEFSWVDYEDEFALDQLTRLDIAELLYFGHKRLAFSSPDFTRLQNRFAFWSHDDGWFLSIYFTDSGDMTAFMSCAVSAIARAKKLPEVKLPDETAKEILGLAEGGLLIDAADLSLSGDMVELPFYVTGKITDMADALGNTALYKRNAQKKGTLRFKKKSEKYPTPFWRPALVKKVKKDTL